jgi:hypothetical protein
MTTDTGEQPFGERLLELMMEALRAALPGCTGVGLGLAGADGGGHSVPAVGVAEALDLAQWEAGDGPLVEAAVGPVAVVCTDLAHDDRWPGFRRPGGCAGLGVMAVPSSWDDHGPVLLTAYVDTAGGGVGPEALAVVDGHEPLLATALGVVKYCSEELVKAEEVIGMMRRRQLIEQAKGIVMGQAGVTAEQAFELLVRVSQRDNVKVRDLASALLARTGDAPDVPQAAHVAAERMWSVLQS